MPPGFLLSVVLCATPSALAVQEAQDPLAIIIVDPLKRMPVQLDPGLLPKDVTGTLPEEDGAPFSLGAWEAGITVSSVAQAQDVLVDILAAAGWTGSVDDLLSPEEASVLGTPDVDHKKELEELLSVDFQAGLEARLGTVTEETLEAVRQATDASWSRLSGEEVAYRFTQLVDGLPVEGMGVLVVVGGTTL